MKVSDYIFWNVDTQFDFVSPKGKLYVSGAELLKPNWEKLTQLAKNKLITVVNTADWHYQGSAELSTNPDFIKTFPQHCMANSAGAEYIDETKPENPFIIDWETENSISIEVVDSMEHRNYIIRKDAFDVFKGNPYTEQILKLLSPETIVVYGVTTNVCVNDAVVGLAKRGKNVIVVENAIKELPNIPLPFENWEKLGVKMMNLDNIEKILQG
ncbi:MAG: cysteine hydrolase [Draconibacterium sp.]|nr:cysteine hydrolase [Draconibacterium sp.]